MKKSGNSPDSSDGTFGFFKIRNSESPPSGLFCVKKVTFPVERPVFRVPT